MKSSWSAARRGACALLTAFAASAFAYPPAPPPPQVKMVSAQQARTSDPANNLLQINNPTSGSTCVGGSAPWVAGDLLVAVVTLDAAGPAVAVTAPGFTQLGATRVAANVQQTVLYRRLTAAPSSVTFSWGPNVPAIAFVYALRGANAVTPIDDAGGSSVDQGATTVAPATTASAIGALQLMVHANSGATASVPGNASPSYPGGCTNAVGRFGRLWGSSTAADGRRLAAGMYAQPVAPGAVSAYATSSVGSSNIGTSLVIKP